MLPSLKNSNNYPKLEVWLKSIGMLEYFDNFLDAGYESLGNILMQIGFPDCPFDDKLLKDHLGISDEKDRNELLKHVETCKIHLNLYTLTLI